ncbi:MAG: hypothetical protein J1D77_00935 [Muribaculaceae bacterium]|nr:hypothetical protein [Muribaculaceae bacterium]
MFEFSALPLSIDLKKRPSLQKEEGDEKQCIDNFIDLLIFTPKGSFTADPDFGFEYWNHEFSNFDVKEFNNNYMGVLSTGASVDRLSHKDCEDSLRSGIEQYEPRLLEPKVRIDLRINQKKGRKKIQSKYEMHITIGGKIKEGLGMKDYEKKVVFMVEPMLKPNVKASALYI